MNANVVLGGHDRGGFRARALVIRLGERVTHDLYVEHDLVVGGCGHRRRRQRLRRDERFGCASGLRRGERGILGAQDDGFKGAGALIREPPR